MPVEIGENRLYNVQPEDRAGSGESDRAVETRSGELNWSNSINCKSFYNCCMSERFYDSSSTPTTDSRVSVTFRLDTDWVKANISMGPCFDRDQS